MHDENTPDPVRILNEAQWLVLNALCRSGGRRSTRELALAVGDSALTGVALATLHAAGLVRRARPGLVCATPAALRAHELELCALRVIASELRSGLSPRECAMAPPRRQRRRMVCRALRRDRR